MQDAAQFVQLAQTLCYDLARAEKATDGKKCQSGSYSQESHHTSGGTERESQDIVEAHFVGARLDRNLKAVRIVQSDSKLFVRQFQVERPPHPGLEASFESIIERRIATTWSTDSTRNFSGIFFVVGARCLSAGHT